MVDPIGLGNHHDPLVAYGEASGAILIQVEPDFGAGRNMHPFIDDGSSHTCVPTDVDPFEQNRIFNVRIAVDPHVWAKDRSLHLPTRKDRALANDAVDCHTAARIWAF